jgi:hypothetical protein
MRDSFGEKVTTTPIVESGMSPIVFGKAIGGSSRAPEEWSRII